MNKVLNPSAVVAWFVQCQSKNNPRRTAERHGFKIKQQADCATPEVLAEETFFMERGKPLLTLFSQHYIKCVL